MPIAFWCVLLAGIMPGLTVMIAKTGAPGYDNADPRAWLDRQGGLARRADNAHRNHFEAFPFFAAAVLSATVLHAPTGWIDLLAVVFIVARIVYTVCYLLNLAALRSLVFIVGYLAVIGIFLLPLLAPG